MKESERRAGRTRRSSEIRRVFVLRYILKKTKTMKKLIAIILLVIHFNAFSQDDPSDGDGLVPVDGGITLLLAAGAAYAGRRLCRKDVH